MATDFPRNLLQPQGSYRFGLDALLLAAFANKICASKAGVSKMAELGSGCGAALLGFLLHNEQFSGVGIDCEPVLTEAAKENAAQLELSNRTNFITYDLEEGLPNNLDRQFDIVIANPPWLLPNSGRIPQSALRRRALCANANTIPAFMRSACHLLQRHGFFCCLLPPGLLCIFCANLGSLGLRQILPVTSYAEKPAMRLLLLAQKDAQSSPRILAPLVLHKRSQTGNIWTDAATDFCPWLTASN